MYLYENLLYHIPFEFILLLKTAVLSLFINWGLIYLTFIYFDTNRALQNSQFIVNSLKLWWHSFELFWHSKHLTNVLQKHTYYTPLYGKIHLHFNIPIFQSSLIIISSVQEMDAALFSLLCRTFVNFMLYLNCYFLSLYSALHFHLFHRTSLDESKKKSHKRKYTEGILLLFIVNDSFKSI